MTSAGQSCEVAVIGCGPYGLAVAAHLNACRVSTRVFGRPMSTWRSNMPAGMLLHSASHTNDIADPHKKLTLDAFAHQHGLPAPADQQPIELFIRYGDWFQRVAVPAIDSRSVIRVEDIGGGRFCMALEDGETVRAQRIVVAMGLTGQEYRPGAFARLPSGLVSHSGNHARFDLWPGSRVAVIGRGQSACESAALLREAGSEVEIICRGQIKWSNARRRNSSRERDARLRNLQHPVAPPRRTLDMLNDLPGVEHRMPHRALAFINRLSLRPAPALWLKPRLTGIPVLAGRPITHARRFGDRIELQVGEDVHVYDHVLLATGYKTDIARLKIFPPELRRRIACTDGSPRLGEGFQSTVPGLHFVGAMAVASYGPLLRLLAGTGYAASGIAQFHLAQAARARFQSLWATPGDFLSTAP
jgi:FAD-dependent urate hydroxylase